MICLLPVQHFEHFRSRGCLVGLRPESIGIVEDDSRFARPVKLPHGFLDLTQFVIMKRWESGLNFSDGTHRYNYTTQDAPAPYFIDGNDGRKVGVRSSHLPPLLCILAPSEGSNWKGRSDTRQFLQVEFFLR